MKQKRKNEKKSKISIAHNVVKYFICYLNLEKNTQQLQALYYFFNLVFMLCDSHFFYKCKVSPFRVLGSAF